MATDTLKSKPGAQGGATGGLRRLLLDNGALTALIVLVIAMSALSGTSSPPTTCSTSASRPR